MRPRAVVAVVVFLLGISSAVAHQSTAEASYDVADAYQIYGVLLPHEEAVDSANGTLIIREETVSTPHVSEPCLTAEAANKFKDAIADYDRVNGKSRLLQRQFQIEKPYEVVSSATIEILLK
jgi:hypothetical protein